jgi:hypothetical protein
MRRFASLLDAVPVMSSLAGCGTDLGTCDMPAATQLVYTAQGTPYYAGQALVQQSCAAGVCHSSLAVGAGRLGAPHGLNFDAQPLSTADNASLAVLSAGVSKIRDEGSDLFGEIEDGSMPPGKVGKRTPQQWNLANGSDAQLPDISTATGKATVRNWLACGAPVVAGVTGVPDAAATAIGNASIVAPGTAATVAATFTSIYTTALTPCAAACHTPGGVFPGLDLSTQAIAYSSLFNKPASTASGNGCAGKGVLVVPGSCQTSLLYEKLQAVVPCGAAMPLGMPQLPDATRAAICSWITAGALNN